MKMESEKILAKMAVEIDNSASYYTPRIDLSEEAGFVDKLISNLTPKPILDEFDEPTGDYTSPKPVTVADLKEIKEKYMSKMVSSDREAENRLRNIQSALTPMVKVSKMILGMEE